MLFNLSSGLATIDRTTGENFEKPASDYSGLVNVSWIKVIKSFPGVHLKHSSYDFKNIFKLMSTDEKARHLVAFRGTEQVYSRHPACFL